MTEILLAIVEGSVFEDNLIELLLTVILLFNVGAYRKLDKRINDVEDDVEENEKRANKMKKSLSVIRNRMFGIEDDETAQGHLKKTNDSFDRIEEKLEEICQKIDKESHQREQEFMMVGGQFDQLLDELNKQENIDIDKSDINEYRNT